MKFHAISFGLYLLVNTVSYLALAVNIIAKTEISEDIYFGVALFWIVGSFVSQIFLAVIILDLSRGWERGLEDYYKVSRESAGSRVESIDTAPFDDDAKE